MKLTLVDFFGSEVRYNVEVEPGDDKKRLRLTVVIEGEGFEAHPQVLSVEELGVALPKDAKDAPLPPQGDGPTFHGPAFPGPTRHTGDYSLMRPNEGTLPAACAKCGNTAQGQLAWAWRNRGGYWLLCQPGYGCDI